MVSFFILNIYTYIYVHLYDLVKLFYMYKENFHKIFLFFFFYILAIFNFLSGLEFFCYFLKFCFANNILYKVVLQKSNL